MIQTEKSFECIFKGSKVKTLLKKGYVVISFSTGSSYEFTIKESSYLQRESNGDICIISLISDTGREEDVTFSLEEENIDEFILAWKNNHPNYTKSLENQLEIKKKQIELLAGFFNGIKKIAEKESECLNCSLISSKIHKFSKYIFDFKHYEEEELKVTKFIDKNEVITKETVEEQLTKKPENENLPLKESERIVNDDSISLEEKEKEEEEIEEKEEEKEKKCIITENIESEKEKKIEINIQENNEPEDIGEKEDDTNDTKENSNDQISNAMISNSITELKTENSFISRPTVLNDDLTVEINSLMIDTSKKANDNIISVPRKKKLTKEEKEMSESLKDSIKKVIELITQKREGDCKKKKTKKQETKKTHKKSKTLIQKIRGIFHPLDSAAKIDNFMQPVNFGSNSNSENFLKREIDNLYNELADLRDKLSIITDKNYLAPITRKDVSQWHGKNIAEWHKISIGRMGENENFFLSMNGMELENLTDKELMNVGIRSLGRRKKLLKGIKCLKMTRIFNAPQINVIYKIMRIYKNNKSTNEPNWNYISSFLSNPVKMKETYLNEKYPKEKILESLTDEFFEDFKTPIINNDEKNDEVMKDKKRIPVRIILTDSRNTKDFSSISQFFSPDYEDLPLSKSADYDCNIRCALIIGNIFLYWEENSLIIPKRISPDNNILKVSRPIAMITYDEYEEIIQQFATLICHWNTTKLFQLVSSERKEKCNSFTFVEFMLNCFEISFKNKNGSFWNYLQKINENGKMDMEFDGTLGFLNTFKVKKMKFETHADLDSFTNKLIKINEKELKINFKEDYLLLQNFDCIFWERFSKKETERSKPEDCPFNKK